MAKGALETYNFSLDKEQAVTDGHTIYDNRNKIESRGTSLSTIDFYINYLTTLQMKQAQWTTFAYFDLGMVPVAMGPSLLHNTIVPFITRLCDKIGVKAYPMRPVSLLPGNTSVDKLENDLWVFRKDIAEATGKTELGFSVIDFLSGDEVRRSWIELYSSTFVNGI